MTKDQIKNQWKSNLGTMAYKVTQEGATERAFSHPGFDPDTKYFACICCDQILFSIEAKYESGSGWPSFFKAISSEVICEKEDLTHGIERTEVTCSKCEGHLGHVFSDGPMPTGLRYCINGVALKAKVSLD